jgi:hypothetical protein
MSRIKVPRDASTEITSVTVGKVALSALCLCLLLVFNPFKSYESAKKSSKLYQSGLVHITSSDDPSTVPYLHCGRLNEKSTEIILLHGSAFKKENWQDSGIMEKLCFPDYPLTVPITVIALDLPVTADGLRLYQVFLSLREEGLIKGDPLILVTPSASGKGVLGLSALYHSNENKSSVEASMISKLLRAWVPIASYAVARDLSSLDSFIKCNIPVLAMYGNKDIAGKRVSEQLIQYADAEVIEIKGGHACYLDSPDQFVVELLNFINNL